MYGEEPDSAFFEEMDPIKKQWLYESWVYSIEKDLEKWRMLGILIGSFTNPEAANKMMKQERPDYVSSDADFAKSIELAESMAQEIDKQKTQNKHRRQKRRVVKNNGK